MGVFSWVVFGHNSGGKSRKKSFIALSNDQTSASELEPESLVACNTFSVNRGVIFMGISGKFGVNMFCGLQRSWHFCNLRS